MIVPLKKVSLIILERDKKYALRRLRRLGLLHIEAMSGEGERLVELGEKISALEAAIATLSEKVGKDTVSKETYPEEALSLAKNTASLKEEKAAASEELALYRAELDRLNAWGEIEPKALASLSEKGVNIALYEMPATEYKALPDSVTTLCMSADKNTVRALIVRLGESESDEALDAIKQYKVKLPDLSTEQIQNNILLAKERIENADKALCEYASYIGSMKKAIALLQKDVEFENFATGMAGESLSENSGKAFDIAYFRGYIPADDLDKLKEAAHQNSWGLLAEDPTPEDDVPTKLHNNKFVSLIYPLTDFLGTVPGYFEYDISAWFLGFILVFFGIIFGDGGYGLLICAIVGALILKARTAKKAVPSAYYLILLMGAATVLWGLLTCTWFGLDPEYLPGFLKKLSLPIISNVNADKLWYPFWTGGTAALTTTQNLQIVCFSLALVQLSAAHIKGMVRNRRSLKLLGDLGAVLQLIGIFYVVLSLVVNSAVFGLGLVIAGIPVGTVAIISVFVGFAMNFVFANYEGSIGQSVLTSLKNIVSCLLGVVNVFSDIVSYIRLWAVGLAGAAISATVNELASPMLGNFMFMIFAIIILVFGHGLNMILNVLSVIVHGVRLNTLEFSTHLDMSWSGHKFKPFEE